MGNSSIKRRKKCESKISRMRGFGVKIVRLVVATYLTLKRANKVLRFRLWRVRKARRGAEFKRAYPYGIVCRHNLVVATYSY